ncbi:MAG: carboxypeptidase-like regulatory domain-containing protein [Planctomycetaceae bacterium]|jgi:type 1 fimbria pilin|nr:carboxypeptidase-like regulatory domain-containing protein [Planctomycetaceae bacterium]
MKYLIIMILSLSLAFAACSRKPYQPKQYAESISGTVTMKSKPIADTEMTFSNPSRKISVTVKTDTAGNFTISPKELPTGRYIVLLSADNPAIPKKYQTPFESPLDTEIQTGKNELKLELEP